MPSNPTDISDLPGLLKPVFGELQFLLPEESLVQKLFSFKAGDSVGKYFQEPIEVRAPWSISWCGNSGDSATFADALPSKTQDVQVTPYLVVLRNQVSYGVFDRAPKDAASKAFMAAGAYFGKSMATQLRRNLELSMLCGQDGFGVVESADDSADTITIDAASFRPGWVSILEGAQVCLRVVNSTTTLRALTLTVSAVNVETRTLSFSGTPNLSTVQGGDTLFLLTSAGDGVSSTTLVYNEMVGLRKQVSEQTATVFNVAKSTYSAFRGNVVTSVGAMSPGALLNIVTKAVNRGFQGKAIALLSPKAWNVLNNRIVSQQIFNQQSPDPAVSAKLGTDSIEVKAMGVTLEVVPHPYQAEGEILVLPKDYVKRIGSSYAAISGDTTGVTGAAKKEVDIDITFAIPAAPLLYILPIVGSSTVELQCRSDQQVYLQRPAWSVLGTGVTY